MQAPATESSISDSSRPSAEPRARQGHENRDPAEAPPEQARPRGHSGVRALIASALTSSVGDGAFVAAAPLLAAFLTRDPLAVSVVGAASAAPWFVVGPWSGALVDRLSRRAVLIWADVVRAVVLAILTALVLTDQASVPALAIAAFLVTGGRSFSDAAAQAMVPQLVGRERDDLAEVNGRLNAAETAGRSLAGPPIGGALFGAAPWLPLGVDAASFALSGAMLTRIPALSIPLSPAQSFWCAVGQGFSHLLHDRLLVRLAIAMAAYNFAYNMVIAMFVLYTQAVLHLGATGFGLLLASGSVGAILIGLRGKQLVNLLGVRGGVAVSAVAQAVAWASLAATASLIVAVVSMLLVGGASTLITVAAVTARQRHVPDQLLGRVVSAFRLLGNGASPLGAATGGAVAAGYGLTAPLWIASALTLGAPLLSIATTISRRSHRGPSDRDG